MKKFLLTLAFLPAVAPIASAGVPAPTANTSNLPSNAAPLTCATVLDNLLGDLQTKTISSVNSTLMVGELALAESPVLGGGGGGFNPVGGEAKLSSGKVVGTSHVAAPGANTRNDLAFTIAKVDGKARLTWTFKGKSYAAAVARCTNGYWTAANTSSAIVVKLGPLQDAPQ
jgi:hypothetical protein